MEQSPLSTKVKLGFGVCDLGGNLFFTVNAFLLLNYLTDSVGIAAGLAGIVIMVGKVWDAITDPIVGYISDRTNTRWGRRRPYILFGSVPLCITMIIMFTNPGLSSQTQLCIWGIVVYCLLNTAYTLVNIPYSALTPELTQDYNERTALNGYRFSFAIIGTLMGAGAALPIVNSFSDKDTGFSAMGAIFGVIMMVTALITFFVVKEPESAKREFTQGFFETYLRVFKNKPFVIILISYALQITGITVASGVTIYYYKYIHNNESMTTIAMLILLTTAMIFIPISVLLARRIGKKMVFSLGMVIFSFGLIIIFFTGHLMSAEYSLGIIAISGIGMGLIFAMPYAIVPDAIEYNYLLTGERTEGSFYGMWTFCLKIGQAVALGITGGVLALTGYIAEVAQTEQALFGIRLLFGPISVIFFIASIALLFFYPINERRYEEILAGITEMEKCHVG